MKDNAAYLPDDGDQLDFSTVTLEEKTEKKKKIPRRILHFSDGVLEEYSTDEEEEEKVACPQPVVDPSTLMWGPWIWNRVATSSTKTLAAVDFCGEKLARLFGILDSRYQYAIDEHNKQQIEEEDERKHEEYAMTTTRLHELKIIDDMESDSGEPQPRVQVISNGLVDNKTSITPPVKVDPLPVNEQI